MKPVDVIQALDAHAEALVRGEPVDLDRLASMLREAAVTMQSLMPVRARVARRRMRVPNTGCEGCGGG